RLFPYTTLFRSGPRATTWVAAQAGERFQGRLRKLAPLFGGRVRGNSCWNKVTFLNVGPDRLEQWCVVGYLCIGEAIHTMSSVGGDGRSEEHTSELQSR